MSLFKIKSFSFKNNLINIAILLSVFSAALVFHLSKTYALSSGPLTVINTDQSGVRYEGLLMGDLSMSEDASMVAIQVSTQSAASDIGVSVSGSGNLIFLKNMNSGAFELISKKPTGDAANGSNSSPEISSDGRFIVFQSNSTDIIDGVNLNGLIKIYLYDNQTGQIEWISKNADGTQPGTWASSPSISADGRYVSYHSGSRTIVPYSGPTTQHIFVYDRENDQTQIVSINDSGVRGNGINRNSSISDDGRFVAFESLSTNFSPNDNNIYYDIYVYDRQNQTIELISKNQSGNASNGISTDPVISGDGRFVVFNSSGTDLVSGYLMSSQTSNIYLYDRQEGVMNVVNVNNQGSLIGSSDSPAVSDDGRYVAFTSFMGNQVPLQYLRDVVTGESFLMTETIDGNFPVGSSQRYGNSISADGRYVAFITGTRVIFPGINSGINAYIYDREYSPDVDDDEQTDPGNSVCNHESTTTSLTINGYAWMGANIEPGSGQSQGGGGWLKLGCDDGEQNWGAKVNFDSGSSNYGRISGSAWSNNYGWLSFEDDIVESCWENAPSETASSPARILFGDSGESVPVVGWAKFINGDDDSNDGYNGCVSFSGVNYGTRLDIQTGALTGWAWGSDVVGWLSFQNPDCPFCDAEVDIPEEEISICEDPLALNTGAEGECQYAPSDILGCTDPTAINYNASATMNDGNCVYDDDDDGGSGGLNVSLDLSATPSIIFTNNPSEPVTLSYQASSPNNIASDSCTGEAVFNGSSITVTGWTDVILADPNSQVNGIDLSDWVSQSGDQFVFTINCEDVDGGELSDTAVVNVEDPLVPTDPPIVELFIDEPNNFPTSLLREEIPVTGVDPFTLRWNAVRVNSCVANSVMYNSGVPSGSNPYWDTSYSPEDDNPNNNSKTFPVIEPSLIRNTIFEIECLPDNPGWNGGQPIRAQVCMNVSGLDFPQCSISGSGNIPSFEEI